jgi:recombination protein RecT
MSGNQPSGTVVHQSQAARNPADVVRNQLATMAGEFKNALPSHIKPEKFQRVVMTVVQQNSDLMTADRKTLLASCLKCAADGLVPDGREAALVLFGNKVQYMPMMAGLQKRVRNSGDILGIEAHVIYANDKFVWRQGIESTLIHEPLFPGERGQAIGAYAVAKFKDGGTQFEVMDRAAIEKVRAVSRAGKSGPWVQWWDEMARKTVFRRMSKWLPMDAESEDLLRRDDENEAAAAPSGLVIDGEAEMGTGTGAGGKLDALEGPSEGPVLEGEVEAPTKSPVDLLIAEIEACENEALLRRWEANAEVRVRIRALNDEDGEAITRSVAAQRMGFREGGR